MSNGIGKWGDYSSNPAYHEVTGEEATLIAEQYGQPNAIVCHGEYTIYEGHVYRFEMPEGMGYDPQYTAWANDPRVTGKH